MMMRSNRSRTSAVLLPGAALALCLGFCTAAAAQVVIGPVDPLPKFPTGGGQYHGPSDLAPPSLPPFDPNDPATCPPQSLAPCNPAQLSSVSCSTASSHNCPSLPFIAGADQCVHCQNAPDGDEETCFAAKGWNLTFGTLRAFCHSPDPSCLDANHNVTVCVTQRDSCEVHLFESSWVNHDLFDNRPVCAPVAAQACLDNNPAPLFSQPQAFSSYHQGTGSCGGHTVCLAFNKDCLCNAVLSWENTLGSSATVYDNQYLFHIGFTTCNTCDCPAHPEPVEP